MRVRLMFLRSRRWQGALMDATAVATTQPLQIVDVSHGVASPSTPAPDAQAARVAAGQLVVCATPAQHWSKRTLTDDRMSLVRRCRRAHRRRLTLGGASGRAGA